MRQNKHKSKLKRRTISLLMSHPITQKHISVEIEGLVVSVKSFLTLHPYTFLVPKGRWGFEIKTDPAKWVISHIPTGMAVGHTISFWNDRDLAEKYLIGLEGPEWDFDSLDTMGTAAYKKWATVHHHLNTKGEMIEDG